jgi:dTMP kinase
MDTGLSSDVQECFKLFQQRIMHEYDAMVEEFGLIVIDGTRSIEEQQAEMRAIVSRRIEEYAGTLDERRR